MESEVLQYLSARRLMALATFGEFPWICNVYYLVDEHFNLYFMTGAETIHTKQMLANPKVAFTITDTVQKRNDKKKAVQGSGEVSRVTDINLIDWFLKNWAEEPTVYDPKDLKTSQKRGIYVIKPTKLKFFNEELYADTDNYRFVEL